MKKSKTILPREVHLLSESPGRAGLRTAVVFPNRYSVGMANLGFQTIYRELFLREDLQVERVFSCSNARSVESGSGLSSFEILFFSISFESDVLNFLEMLQNAGIPLKASQRSVHDPLIVVGGIVPTTNPLVLTPFVDIFLRGESEVVLRPFLDILTAVGQSELLKSASQLPGAYVPEIHFDEIPPLPPKADFNAIVPAHSVILSKQSEFPDLFLVEISRGCRNCCRFCGVSRLQGQPRYHGQEKVLSLIEGYGAAVKRVGLVAADVGANPEFQEICRKIIDSGRGLTTSSVETTAASEQLLQLMVQGGQKTLTVAPEAGDESIRRRLAKPISDARILETCRMAAEAGLPSLKLYFLIGLSDIFPDMDIDGEAEAICSLLERIDQIRGRSGSISVNLSPLVPRVGTPISDSSLPTKNTIRKIISKVRHRQANKSNIKVQAGSWFEAATEWLINHGDAESGRILASAVEDNSTRRGRISQAIASKISDFEDQ